jgi:phytoene dehydrogenase-like protein
VTKRDQYHPADLVISNIPPWNTNQLFSPEDQSHPNPRMHPVNGWGAFVLYLGVDAGLIPNDFPLHHQVILARPMGEGNTIFLSISPAWDDTRAPQGKRSITISTHTTIETWWKLFDQDRDAYQARKQVYTTKVLAAAETILPGIHEAADLILPGTPVTFQRFTRRARGWVGGFPQTGLLQSIAPYLGRNMWMVGDSIFPGQSIAATSLGGLRVACDVLERLDVQKKFKQESKISHDPRQSEQFSSGSGFKVTPVTLRGTKKNEMEFS